MASIELAIKRLFDFIVASTALIFLSPIIVLIAIAIKWDDHGPVLFIQPRVGKGCKIFNCYKFRTMVLGAESIGNGFTVTPDDSRITRVGRWLRLWSLDEIPQLFNVLKGEMSIVGPRPWVPVQAAYCSPADARRFDFKPGLAGWAVVNGRNRLSWADRIRLDVWYVDHWSLGLDLSIFARAFVVLLSRDGVYDVASVGGIVNSEDRKFSAPFLANPLIGEQQPHPVISVIIPVHNAATTLKSCLEAVVGSDYSSYECIVVDDGSTDGSEMIARAFSTQVLKLTGGPMGPAHARNRGAQVARGNILFFVDADVVLAQGALRQVETQLQKRSDLAALFGSYDARPKAKGLISQYRNLLHHYVHQNGNPDSSTFWAGCGAIRRSVFEKIAGFDSKRFSRPSIEDIELGYRMRQSGYRILLDKTLQGTHLKQWSLYSLITTDIACRAVPWSRLILESKQVPNDLNLEWGQRISLALVALACALTVPAVLQPELLGGSAVALLGVAVLNRNLYAFFFRQRGILFTAASISLHLFYYLYSGLSYSWVWADFNLRRMAQVR